MAKFEVTLNGSIDEIAAKALGGRDTKRFMAERATEYMKPYVPRNTGYLAESAEVEEDGDDFAVVYTAPYAEEQYYWAGVRQSRNPSASSYWDKAAMDLHYDALLADVERKVKGNG